MNQSAEVLISIVSPVYRAEGMIKELVERIRNTVLNISSNYEIILVEDGSPDNSWDEIVFESVKNDKIKGIKLSRNFGQHFAITAGLDYAKGDWVVVMDCDLQDRPEEIINLYQKAQEGYDIVLAKRSERKDSLLKKLSSLFFYKVFSYMSGIPQDSSIANFGIYSKKVIKVLNTMREPMRAFSPMIKWVGFKSTAIEVQHESRLLGKSSYNIKKLVNLAIDICISYSDKPLKLTIKTGFLISFFSILYTIYNLIAYKLGIIKISGFTSLIISVWILSGLIIFTLGITGLYISRIFEGIKSRPIYIIESTTKDATS